MNEGFEQYLAIETAGGPTWHPEKDEIAFVYNAPGYFQVFSVPVKQGFSLWPTRLTFDSERCTSPHYLEDGSIIFLKDRGGDENFQIGHLNLDSKLTWITSDLKAKHVGLKITNSTLYYSANVENKAAFAIYRHKFPLQINTPELLYQPDQGIYLISEVSPDEKYLILGRIHGNNDQELLLYDVEQQTVKNITELISGKDKNRWVAVRWLDQDHVLVLTDYKSEFVRLAIITPSGDFNTMDEFESDLKYDITNTAWTRNSPYTYYTLNEEGYNRLFQCKFTSKGCNELKELNIFPEHAVVSAGDARSFGDGLAISNDGNKLAITLSTPTSPVNIWIHDLQLNSTWKTTNVNTGGLDPAIFVGTELNDFTSFDSLRVPYFKYLPRGTKPEKGWPAIIVIHGGPESQIRPGFSPMIQFFLSAGFAVITPNIRGSTGYGRTYLDLDNKEKRLDSIRDIKWLVKQLKEKEDSIDSNRLVIFGGSYGGFAVLSAMTEYPDLWKAGIDVFGIADFVTFLQNTAEWRRGLRASEYGSLENDMETLIRISPIHKVDKIKAPLFIIAGDNDERVPVSESIQMYEKLKAKGLQVELLRFADEGHGITKLENKITAYARIIEWLKKFV